MQINTLSFGLVVLCLYAPHTANAVVTAIRYRCSIVIDLFMIAMGPHLKPSC